MSVLQQASQYCDAGLAIVPVPHQSKACQLENWQNTRLTRAELPKYFNGAAQNIALVCGEASGGICVVDCDWPEAGRIARHIFETPTYGRASDPTTHFLLKCPALTQTVKHAVDAASKRGNRRRGVVEILADGHQCLLPGSTHVNGDAVVFSAGRDLEAVAILTMDAEQLRTWAARIAGAAVLLYHWPDFEGSRHDLTLALVGACLHAGWSPADVFTLFGAFFSAADDELKDRKKAVEDTVARFTGGETTSGWPGAVALLGDLAQLIEDKWQLNQKPVDTLVIGSASTAGAPEIVVGGPVIADWQELLPFDEKAGGHLEYPIAALGPLQAVVVTAAHIQQAPVGLVAQCTLAAVATAVQSLFDVEVPHGRYPTALFLLTLGETGERKSSTDSLLFKPHDDWARAALSVPDDDEIPGFRPHPFFEGGTVEGLRRQLAAVWPSVCANNSDAGDFIGGYSMREGRETATAAVLCKLWDGALRSYMRGSDTRPISLYGRRISLSWMIQPQHVHNLVNGGMAAQGLLSRMLISYPQSRIGSRSYVVPDPAHLAVLDNYYARVTALLEVPLTGEKMDVVSGQLSPIPLCLDEGAKRLYSQLADHYERTLAPDGLNFGIRDHANKSLQHLARLSGVMAAFESAPAITSEHIERAKILLDYYLAEWRALGGKLGAIEPGTQKAKLLLEWLHTHVESNPGPFSLRDCCRGGPRVCGRSADEMKQHLNSLIRRGYIRPARGNRYELRPVGME